jgi:integrase
MTDSFTQPEAPKKRKRDRLDPRKVRIGGKTFWQVNLGSELRAGRRHRLRRTFASAEEAATFAKLRKIERINHGTAGVTMSDKLRGEAIEADRLLSPYKVSILDLVRDYIRRHQAITRSETSTNAFVAFMSAKTSDGLRPRYLCDLRSRVGRFAQYFKDRKLADIDSAEIDSYLRALEVAPLTRNTVAMRLSVFFEYCRTRGWVEVNPLTKLSKAKVQSDSPGILTPEEVARLLEAASEQTLPVFALGAFAGLRSAEIERLEWRHIKWEKGLVEVPAASSKTASRRLVTMQPNLVAWLQPYRMHQGVICPPNHFRKLIGDRHRAGIVKWPSNALRHSFASYHLAAFRNAPALSLELGHVQPQMVFRHDRELVKPADADKFWRIVPAISAEPKIAVVA